MKEIKQICLSLACILIIFLAIDIFCGYICDRLNANAKYDFIGRQNYVIDKADEDILIIGSSRASHHYVPSIISDSLGLSCFNAGSDGMCIYYHYALLKAAINRGYIPKIVIFDFFDFDLIESSGSTFTKQAAIDRLSYKFGINTDIERTIKEWDAHSYLYSLNLYKYNSKILQLLSCNYIKRDEPCGYIKLDGVIDEKESKSKNLSYKIEEDKTCYLHRIVDLLKKENIEFVTIYSPILKPNHHLINEISNILNRNNISLLDFSSIITDSSLYYDQDHLNQQGAESFTKYLIKYLRPSLQNGQEE